MQSVTKISPTNLVVNNQFKLTNLEDKILINIFTIVIQSELSHFFTLSHTCKKFSVLLAKHTDPTTFLIQACKNGCYSTIKMWLYEQKNLNFFNNSLPFFIVCEAEGKKLGIPEDAYNKALKILLDFSKAKQKMRPASSKNFCIKIASKNGNVQIVETLLNSKRCDPSDKRARDKKDALYLACENGQYEVVDILLKNTEVIIPSDEAPLHKQDPDKYIELKEFSNRRSFDPLKNWKPAFLVACKNNHSRIVSRLLKQPRIDPCFDHSKSLCIATHYGSLEVIDLLVKDGRVDLSCALKHAKNNNNKEIQKLLKSKKTRLSYFNIFKN